MKTLDKEQYRLLKDRLYRAENAFFLSLESCPDLEHHVGTLSDGKKISAHDVLVWLNSARKDAWRYGPTEVRKRKLKEVMSDQPRG